MYRHGFILSLFIGAAALFVVLGSFLLIELRNIVAPYFGYSKTEVKTVSQRPPRLETIIRDTDIIIAELSSNGEIVKTVYTSSLVDAVSDFILFAVPQENYAGVAYVRSLQDAKQGDYIIYPLEIATKKLGAWVINTEGDAATLSPNQEMVAIVKAQNASQIITLYDLTLGSAITSWTLGANEWLTPDPYATKDGYDSDGVKWVSDNCFEHVLWIGEARRGTPLTQTTVRTFCAEAL